MFPIPEHLPRTAAAGIAPPVHDGDQTDAVLDLLGPLFTGEKGKLSVDGVRGVQSKLQDAIADNKASDRSYQPADIRPYDLGSTDSQQLSTAQRTHQLVLARFPDISSHIRLGTDLRSDFGGLKRTLEDIEQKLDPADDEVSFLPPVLSLLERHFAAVQAKARADAHVQALKALQRTTDRLGRLEEAIWAGRGADEWVVEELRREGYRLDDAEDVLGGTQALKAAQQRLGLFRSMVIEQVSDAFGKAVSLTSAPDAEGYKLSVRPRTSLQQPRIPRPAGNSSTSSTPPPYSLSHLYTTLSSFGSLQPTLEALRTKIVRDLVTPLVAGGWKASSTSPDQHELFQLERSTARSPKHILDDVSLLLAFVNDHVVPPTDVDTVQSARRAFLAGLATATFEAVKTNVLITGMPPSLAAIPAWLETVHQALSIEEAHPYGERVILPFFQIQAGEAWANQRRTRVGEEVRKLVVGGWGGWEAKEVERERVVTMVVEVEVDGDDEVMGAAQAVPGGQEAGESTDDADDGFGWGFDDEAKDASTAVTTDTRDADGHSANGASTDVVDDGWGFDESAQAGPSSPRQSLRNGNVAHETAAAAGPETGEGDGWDFDMEPMPAPEPPKPILAKPAREAKKLGKKVAKAKPVEDDDPWGSEPSGSESMQSSRVLPPQVEAGPGDEAGGWDWDEPDTDAPGVDQRDSAADTTATDDASQLHVRAKRKELKEEKRTIRETLLISRACDKLVDIAERVLREARDLSTNELPSPSFAVSAEILLSAATDVFDLHRSLLPSHFAPQLRDVPTLSMQLQNDAHHLADRVAELAVAYPAWTDSELVALRLRALADHAFETQLASQCGGIMEAIDEADGFAGVGTDPGLRKAQRAVQGVVHNVDTIARVLKVVLPTTTYLAVVGYLLDEAVRRITADILDLRDITELESERITELLRPIRALEEVFAVQDGQPSNIVAHVPHWLKFCYVSELLQANLVDILYLFDSGALIDFTTSELVSLVRALFADSEKRDHAIERIEHGARAGEASGPLP